MERLKSYQRTRAAVVIQKYIKGKIVAAKYETQFIKMRLANHAEYFDNMRKKMHLDAICIILRQFKAYRFRKEIDDRIERSKRKNYIRNRVRPRFELDQREKLTVTQLADQNKEKDSSSERSETSKAKSSTPDKELEIEIPDFVSSE